MPILVRKDPTRRLGGWAIISFPGRAPSGLTVIIERDGGTEFLGPHGWQSAPHQSDPYKVEASPEGAFVRVGPEIVNHLEPYMPVTIKLPEAGLEETLSWPDEVIPSPDAFEGGGVQGDAFLMPQAPHLRQDRPPEPLPPEPEPPAPPPPPAQTFVDPLDAPVEPEKVPPPPVDTPARRASPLPWVLLVLLLLSGAGVAGYLYWEEITEFVEEVAVLPASLDPEPEPEPEGDPEVTQETDPIETDPPEVNDPVEQPDPPPVQPPVEETQPAMAPPVCDSENATAQQDVDRLLEVMRLCRDQGNVPVEVEALDRLPASGDTDLRWGQIYDPSREEDGRPFRLNADSALRSYKRALGRGKTEAEGEIARLCGWLSEQGGVSNQAVFARHCE